MLLLPTLAAAAPATEMENWSAWFVSETVVPSVRLKENTAPPKMLKTGAPELSEGKSERNRMVTLAPVLTDPSMTGLRLA